MPLLDDTIAALSTPVGTSAIAMLRVSGRDALRVAEEIFGHLPPPREMRRADYRDRGGALVDDVVFAIFRGPRSYTGEDTLEVSCHGNPFVVRKILDDLYARGCRAAEPGEFTQRAFVNGRIDLSQAEAVMDVIHARSERALESAHRQLRGALGRRANAAVERLLGVIARVEAYIDFPEEDLPPEDRDAVANGVREVALDARKLQATKNYGDILRGGLRVVIAGKPNAGKSSLLNRLVGHERALVSEEPGTTRDFIEEQVMMGSHLIRLVDTAGLNPSPARLEQLGIVKTRERLEDADLVLFVVDAAEEEPFTDSAADIRTLGAPTLLVLNKCDVVGAASVRAEYIDLLGKPLSVVQVSAVSGSGVPELVSKIMSFADGLQIETGEDAVAINARHAVALAEVERCAEAALQKLANGAPMELLASDLRGALHAWEEISGKVDNERMLDELFSSFCIGK